MKVTRRVGSRWALAVIGILAATVVPTSAARAGEGAQPASGSCGRPCTTGYYLAGADGGVFAFGDAPFLGSMAGKALAAPVVDIASVFVRNAPDELVQPRGYYLAGADGGVFAFGDAPFFGSMAGKALSAPIVAIVASPSAEGYWLLGTDGVVYSFGDAKPPLPPPTTPLQAPVVDFDLTWAGAVLEECGPSLPVAGRSDVRRADYDGFSWGTLAVNAIGDHLVGTAEGDALEVERDRDRDPPLLPNPLAAPLVAVAAPTSGAYWLAAADGGVFTFGFCTPFYGSMGGKALAAPVVDMDTTTTTHLTTNGYLLAGADGGVFAFGGASFSGSMAGKPLAAPVVGLATTLGA